MIKAIYVFVGIAVLAGLASFFTKNAEAPKKADPVACTMDAMQCSDGSSVGRSGPNCEFVCPAGDLSELEKKIEAKKDLITLSYPKPNEVIIAPFKLEGAARGVWFFEASFPIVLTDWDGLIVAEGHATAVGDWMTTEFVPFTAVLNFTNPYPTNGQYVMKKGTLILKKDNPSGLPENDDSLEIPVRFAE